MTKLILDIHECTENIRELDSVIIQYLDDEFKYMKIIEFTKTIQVHIKCSTVNKEQERRPLGTLGAETFASRNFCGFREFWSFSR